MNSYEYYEKTRFNFNKNRRVVWREIVKYIQKYIKKDSCILDLGSGYCDFINFIPAKTKYALDKYIDPNIYASEKVIKLLGDYSLMDKKIKNESLDVVFASNFFEHLNENDLEKYMEIIQKKLRKKGILIIIQPNYKLCYKNYFDDYTHTRVWTEISLKDYLKNKKFFICLCKPGFLPFSMKTKFPKKRFLIKLYLKSPIKPFATQMLIIAKKSK